MPETRARGAGLPSWSDWLAWGLERRRRYPVVLPEYMDYTSDYTLQAPLVSYGSGGYDAVPLFTPPDAATATAFALLGFSSPVTVCAECGTVR